MAYGFNEDKEKVNVYSSEEIGQLLRQFMLSVYPVGSIYMTTNATNPGDLFGGTWARWGSGRVPVSVNSNDANFNAVEKTGGAATVTLTSSQIPSHVHTVPSHGHAATASTAGEHSHNVQRWKAVNNVSGGQAYLAQGSLDSTSYTSANGSHTHTIAVANQAPFNTQATGGSGAHSNLQPYITCYMWKRTA